VKENRADKKLVSLVFTLFLISINIITIENGIASGNTIYVDDGGGADYTTIQAAVDAADSGDTIYVYAGTYNENVEIEKNLTITGQNKDTTIVDGGKNGHVIFIYGSSGNLITSQISGFTMKNAGGLGYDCIALSYVHNSNINNNKIVNSDESDGIQLDHCKKITINNNIIKNNDASGINLILSEDNIIHNNVIQSNQKGMYIQLSSINNQIYDNTITGNSQYGIHIIQSSNNVFYRNDFTDNGQNAQDPLLNYWSNNSEGNYWDDYTGYDNNSDDVGDVPYDIPGGDNIDDYPLGYFKESESQSGNQKPTAHLPSISPNPATAGDSITFSGSGSDSDGYIVGYNWRSNVDGQLSTKREFSSSILSAGTHIIYFKIKDNDDEWSSEKTATLIINSNDAQTPKAFIDSIAPNPATTEQSIYFIGHGTDNGDIIEYKWISDIDGIISSNKSFESSSLSKGAHTISFQVKDNDNIWSIQDKESLTISDSFSNLPPIANAGGPYTGFINEKINFNGADSYDDDGHIVEYLWDFGDGTLGTGKSQKHTFSNPGNYSIKLTVTDNNGLISKDITYSIVLQSINESSNSEGFLGFNIEVPFPVVVVFAPILIIVIIALFLYWFKRK
jgi:parallel beta-helix repeat protein